MMDGWKEYLNKVVSVYYDDGASVSKKIGRLIKFNESFLFLDLGFSRANSNKIAIPINRIIRIEVGS